MPNDPIERITTDIEIFGIPQPAGAPPMTEAYLHVRYRPDGSAESAKMGLPAYEGKQGPPGPPGAIHQGEKTTAQLNTLAATLNQTNVNWAYRNLDTDDQYVWDGDSWVVYHHVYATPGETGPAPNLQSGTLTVDGVEQSGEFGVRVAGTSPNYSIGLDLPSAPKGDKGDPGASGSIYDSIDVDDSTEPNDGDVLAHDAALNKLIWSPGGYWIEEYVVPPSGFPNANKSSTDIRQALVVLTIPAKSFRYRFDFTGGVDVNATTGHQIDLEIRTDVGTPTNPDTNGPLVGYGKGQNGEGWREVAFRAHSDTAIDPDSSVGVIEPGTVVKLYVSAVKVAGVITGWGVRNTKAQLRVRLLRVR